ncbi:hypothetical protein ABK040_003338 [Willaertia magna]
MQQHNNNNGKKVQLPPPPSHNQFFSFVNNGDSPVSSLLNRHHQAFLSSGFNNYLNNGNTLNHYPLMNGKSFPSTSLIPNSPHSNTPSSNSGNSNNSNNNKNSSLQQENNQPSNSSNTPPSITAEDPMMMMKMIQQCMQMNNNTSPSPNLTPTIPNSTTIPPNTGNNPMDQVAMFKMFQMFNNGVTNGVPMGIPPTSISTSNNLLSTNQQQANNGYFTTNQMVPPYVTQHKTGDNSIYNINNMNNNVNQYISSPTSSRSNSPPPRPSSPTILQNSNPLENNVDLELSQKYNLVEKKKRKMRCGKKRGPQEQFIFHLKLEQDKRKKRKNKNQQQTLGTVASTTTLSSSQSNGNVPGLINTEPITVQNNIMPLSGNLGVHPQATSNNNNISSTVISNNNNSHPPLKRANSSSTSLGTTIKTKQRKATKKVEAAKTKLLKTPSNSSIQSNNSKVSSANNTNDNINSSFENFLDNDEIEKLWDEVQPQYGIDPLPSIINNKSNNTLLQQQRPRGCYYGDKSKTKKVQRIPVSQTNPRQQIIGNYRKKGTNPVISSLMNILNDNNDSFNFTIPCAITLLDGLIIKVNEAMKEMIGFKFLNEMENCKMIQSFIHPNDLMKNDLFLLQMLSTNNDTGKNSIRFVNRNGRASSFLMEVTYIRNDMGLPQWVVLRILNNEGININANNEVINQSYMNLDLYYTEQLTIDEMNDLNQFVNRNKADLYPTINVGHDILANNRVNSFQQLFINLLDRLFLSKQPTCFYDRNGTILWNNERFESLFKVKRKSFIGRKVFDISEMKNSVIEFLAQSVLAEFPEKLEAQSMIQNVVTISKSTNMPVNNKCKVHCYGQKVTEGNGSILGYVWLFSIIPDTTENEMSSNTALNEENTSLQQVQYIQQQLPEESFIQFDTQEDLFGQFTQ